MIIPSPCRGVCLFDDKWQLCLGCSRTRFEKFKWLDFDSDYKLLVIEQLPIRKEIFKNEVEFK